VASAGLASAQQLPGRVVGTGQPTAETAKNSITWRWRAVMLGKIYFVNA
jgi:hypothetical protein